MIIWLFSRLFEYMWFGEKILSMFILLQNTETICPNYLNSRFRWRVELCHTITCFLTFSLDLIIKQIKVEDVLYTVARLSPFIYQTVSDCCIALMKEAKDKGALITSVCHDFEIQAHNAIFRNKSNLIHRILPEVSGGICEFRLDCPCNLSVWIKCYSFW